MLRCYPRTWKVGLGEGGEGKGKGTLARGDGEVEGKGDKTPKEDGGFAVKRKRQITAFLTGIYSRNSVKTA